ncbi:MAG TPA: hypothetical protein DCP28_08680, partial [Cytophagales bacterium]|nr:hypothetical protein [Cytophagales bacterium]
VENAPEMREGEYGFAASGSHLAVADGARAWLGTGGSTSRVLSTEDMGNTWSAVETSIQQGEPSQGIFSLSIHDRGFGVAVGGDYTQEEKGQDHVLVTHDFGTQWQLVSPTGVTFLSAVVLAGGQSFFAIGPQGIFYSPDAGHTWQRYDGAGFHTLEATPSGNVLWASGPAGRIGRLVLGE